MNRILSLVRRCVEDYDMIQPDDRVAVGVSGGKDSLTLLVALAKLREFYPIPFTVEAFTLDMGAAEGRPRMDFSPIAQLCREMEVPYTILGSETSTSFLMCRKEKNPCSMCAKMRRGALHSALLERGIHKIALGHHYDDAVETFFMSLIFEGRLSCFQPVTCWTGLRSPRSAPCFTAGRIWCVTPPGASLSRWWRTPALPTATPSARRSRS